MQNKGLASVIIPTFNRPTYLAEAVESVLSQTYPAIEIIIIDDGTKDEGKATRQVLEPYVPLVTYVYQENRGIGAAVNRGISLAKGEFIQRLDDDDRLHKEKIEKCVQVFDQRPAVGLVATGYQTIDGSGNCLRSNMARPYPGNAGLLFSLMSCISAQVAVMVRRSCHEVVGLYRADIMAEDYEMWIRIARRYEIATINEPLAFYRRHQGNITNPANQPKLERDVLQFTRSYLEEIPLEELIPGIKSEAHGYALKAAIYLQRNTEHARSIELAQEELKRALRLAPDDPLLFIWQMVHAIHRGAVFELEGDVSELGGFQELAMSMNELAGELPAHKEKCLPPSSPEMMGFRERFGRLRGELTKETYMRAVEQCKR